MPNPHYLSFSQADLPRKVLSIALQGIPTIKTTTAVFHWKFFLRTSTGSVVLNMSPGADGAAGVLIISSKPYAHSNDPSADLKEISVADGVTVNMVISVLVTKGVHQFVFNNGSGCLHWCQVVVEKLEVYRMISPGTLGAVNTFLGLLGTAKPARVPMPIVKGTFY